MKFLRAFWLTLRFALRGEKPPALQHPQLLAWVQQLAVLVDAVYLAADQSQLDKTRRQAIRLKLDGRLMSVENVLAAVRYHARQEYPSLLRSGLPYNRLSIQASNVNDHYWVSRLLDMPELQSSAIKSSLLRLTAHLNNLPSPEGP
jgi:hypothetical protein